MSYPKHQHFLLTLALSFLLFASNAHAENKETFSLAYYRLAYKEPGISLNPTMLSLQANYRIWGGLSIESRLAYSLSSASLVQGDNETEVDMSLISGGYLKYNILADGWVSPYVIGGYSYGEFEVTKVKIAGTLTLDNTAAGIDSLSYGVGMDIKLSKKFFLGIEYMDYFEKNSVEVAALALNISYKF